MKKSIAIIMTVFMLCLVGLASADIDDGNPDINVEITPYLATETVDDETGETVVTEDWGNTLEYSMELEDNLGDVDVEFYDFDEEAGIIKLKINGNKWFCEEGENKIVYGSDATLNAGDFRVEVTDVYFYGEVEDDETDDGIFGSSSDDIPVEVFIRLSNGETKTLGQLDDEDGKADEVNLEEYSNDDWFNSNFETEKLELFVERIDTSSVITDIDLDSEDASVNDYEHVKNNDNMIFFEVDENGVYILKVTFEEESLWGDEKETDVFFKLDVKGLDNDGNTSSSDSEEGEVLFTDTASIYEGKTWTKTIEADGEWTNTGGLTVTKNENGAAFDYVFKAMTSGSYTPEFTSVDGDTGTIAFTVKEKQVVNTNNGVNVTQNTGGTSNNNGGTTANQGWMDKVVDNKGAAAIMVIAILGILFMLVKGGGKSEGGVTSGGLIDKESSILNSGGEDE